MIKNVQSLGPFDLLGMQMISGGVYATFRLFYLIGRRVIGWKTTPSCHFHTIEKIQARGRPPLFSILKAAHPPNFLSHSAGDPFGGFHFSKPPLPEQFFRVFLSSSELCYQGERALITAFNQFCLGSLITHYFVTLCHFSATHSCCCCDIQRSAHRSRK